MLKSVRSGSWSDPGTWSENRVPLPEDRVFIVSGHTVVFSEPPDPTDECAFLLIARGAALELTPTATLFRIGGGGPASRGGILLAGGLTIPAGVTVEIDPDGNAASAQDGILVAPGGFLRVQGAVLHDGLVARVQSDDGGPDIAFEDSGLPSGLQAGRVRVVWRSGDRKGRWYDVRRVNPGRLVLDANSRSNTERLGQPDHSAGSASVAGSTVTGYGTAWDDALAAGSWWWCGSDGPAAKVRVRNVESPTSLRLAAPYAGTGCASPAGFVLRDENQPFPAVDVSERIRAGDAYRVILPATVRSRYGSDLTFDEQIFIRILDGGSYHFENASFESLGREAWGPDGGSGISITGFDGRTDPGGVFDTVEVYRYAGDAGVEWVDSTHFDVDWLFLHWAHPLITTSNEGHGAKFRHARSWFRFEDVRVRNARFDRTNDDFVWWDTAGGGRSGVYDSIGKYCPVTASGHSCDAVDTSDEVGAPGGELAIERNLFANIGARYGGSCLAAGAGPGNSGPSWTGKGWVARDNVCLNLQSVGCLETVGAARAWDREAIWAVNNVCASVWGNAVRGIPNLYQNQLLDYGLRRWNTAHGVRGPYRAFGNILRAAPIDPGDTHGGRGFSVGGSLEGEAHWEGTTWNVSDNVVVASLSGIRLSSWSSPGRPASGTARIQHNVLVTHPSNQGTIRTYGVTDGHEEPAGSQLWITDNIIEQPFADSLAGDGATAAASTDWVDGNVTRSAAAPAWGGTLAPVRNYPVSSGLDAASWDFEIKPWSPAWTVATFDGDRPGPRFAGVLAYRLPFLPAGLIPSVDPEDDDVDSDGDGLLDRWDNCPRAYNPGWVDSGQDGSGDACDDTPAPLSKPRISGDGGP
jgi:hypothetical protein